MCARSPLQPTPRSQNLAFSPRLAMSVRPLVLWLTARSQSLAFNVYLAMRMFTTLVKEGIGQLHTSRP